MNIDIGLVLSLISIATSVSALFAFVFKVGKTLQKIELKMERYDEVVKASESIDDMVKLDHQRIENLENNFKKVDEIAEKVNQILGKLEK